MRQLWVMTASDLRQRVRDRSVLIFGLAVPLALMFVFTMIFGGSEDLELEPVTVAVAAPTGDELAGTVVAALGQIDHVSVAEVSPDEAPDRARAGHAALGLVLPEGFGRQVMRGAGAEVEVTEGDDAGLEGDVVLAVLSGVLDQMHAGAVAVAAGEQAGLPEQELAAVARAAATQAPAVTLTEGRAATEQLSASGALVAGQAGLFLLFTVGFGVLALVAEREQGTMARLMSMPMRPDLVVVAKGLVSFVLGVVATSVLLTAGALLFGVSFGSPVVVAALVLCAVAAGTSLMFIIARVARSAEQASIVQSILALVLGIAGGAFFPLSASGLAGQVLDLNPIAAFTRGLGISAGGGGLGDVGVPVAVMLGFAAVCLMLSRLVPDRGSAP